MSYHKSWKLRLLGALVLVATMITGMARLAADDPVLKLPDIITCGSVVTLRLNGQFENSFYYVRAVPGTKYTYKGCDAGMMAIDAAPDASKPECWWVVKGMYNGNHNLESSRFGGVRLGAPLLTDNWISFENYATGHTLRLCSAARSIYSSSVGAAGDRLGAAGIKSPGGVRGDAYDYMRFNGSVPGGSLQLAWNVMVDGMVGVLGDANAWPLRCDPNEVLDGAQVIDVGPYDPKMCAVTMQLICQPYSDKNVKEVREAFVAQEKDALSYRTPIYVDLASPYTWSLGTGRIWTSASSWITGSDPVDPWELFVGVVPLDTPNDCNDFNIRSPASCMMIVNAKDPKITGPVKWGDQVRIYSLYATHNADPKRTSNSPHKVELPFRVWVLGQWWRDGQQMSVQVHHPDNKAAKSMNSVWTLIPAMTGITGEMHHGDVFLMQNVGSKSPAIFAGGACRFGYSNLWGTAGAIYASSRPGLSGGNFWSCSQVDANWFNAHPESKAAWAGLAKSFAEVMGGDASALGVVSDLSDVEIAKKAAEEAAAKLAAAKAAEEQVQAEQAKKAAELKAAQDAAAAKQAAADAAAKKAADDAAKQAAADAAAKAAEAAKALAEQHEKELQDAAKAAELLKAETQKAQDALKKAQDATDPEKKAAMDEQLIAAFDANQKKQRMDAFAKRASEVADLPAGFEKIAGNGFSQVAVGSKNVAKGGANPVSTGIALLKDGTLLEFTDPHVDNPWQVLNGPDGKVTYVAAGDGRCAVITEDGKVFVSDDADHVEQMHAADSGEAVTAHNVGAEASPKPESAKARHHRMKHKHKHKNRPSNKQAEKAGNEASVTVSAGA